MSSPAVIVGLGQLGGVFAHGLLRSGVPVHPVNRGDRLADTARAVAEPSVVLVTVGESDLGPVLEAMPDRYRDRVALVQNELFASDWRSRGIESPTVASVWFEKKKAKPLHPIVPTPIAGPRAALLRDALAALEIETEVIDAADLPFELARKTVYILTANLAGLEVGGAVGALFSEHRALALEVARDAMDLCEHRAAERFDRDALLAAVEDAVEADLEHGTVGRSAPARLRRAIAQADEAGLEVPRMRALARAHL